MLKAFTITGKIKVRGRPIKDTLGNVVGYKLKDGTEVKLIVALDVNRSNKYTVEANTQCIRDLGFELVEYDEAKFETIHIFK
jgi:hypothetical protein